MNSFIKIFTLLNFIGFVLSLVGILWLDWSIVNTLPLVIVCAVLTTQAVTSLFNQLNIWKTISLILLGVQTILCSFYFFEVFALAELWKWIFALLFFGILIANYSLLYTTSAWMRLLKISLFIVAIAGFLLADLSAHGYTIALLALILNLLLQLFSTLAPSDHSTKVPKP